MEHKSQQVELLKQATPIVKELKIQFGKKKVKLCTSSATIPFDKLNNLRKF